MDIVEVEKYKQKILNEGVLPLRASLDHSHSHSISKSNNLNISSMIELYTLVYKVCVQDKTKDKKHIHDLYMFHQHIMESFLHDAMESLKSIPFHTLRQLTTELKNFYFFQKNVNLIFRYLDQYFISRFNMKDLHSKTLYLFKSIYFPRMEEILCTTMGKECQGEEFLDDFKKFWTIHNELGLDGFGIQRSYIRCRKNVLNEKVRNTGFDNVLEIIPFFQKLQLEEISLLRELSLLDLEDEISILVQSSLRTSDILEMVGNHFHLLMEKADPTYFVTFYSCFGTYFPSWFEKYVEDHILDPQGNFFDQCLGLHLSFSRIGMIMNEFISLFKKKWSVFMESSPSYYGKLCQRILEDEKYVSTLHYLTNKEEFQRVYGTKMKQRILSELSEFNTDKEIQTLQTLKPYLGTTMIFKLESILLDLNQSLMLHRAFGGGSAPLKMQVFIFADSSMISSKGKNISLPLSIRPSLEPFQKFYHSRFESRALSWDHWNSYVEVESSFPCSGKKMYFSMSVMQFCILDCIVREGPQTIMDLVKKLEWDKSLILPLLHSLTRKDVPLLTKSGSGGGSRVSVHDAFDWNHVVEKILMDGIKHRFSLPLADTKTNVEPTGTPPKESQHRIRSQIMKILKKEQFSSASSLYQRLKRNGCEVSEKEMVDQLKYLEKQEYVERRNVKEREKEGDLYHYLP